MKQIRAEGKPDAKDVSEAREEGPLEAQGSGEAIGLVPCVETWRMVCGSTDVTIHQAQVKGRRYQRELYQSVTFSVSFWPNDLLQFGHFLDRDVLRSSTQPLQKTCPHVTIAVSLKFVLQTVQMAIA